MLAATRRAAAPTGAGKTLVASYAVHRAISVGRRVFTTPIKALSNQKFNDLVDDYGASQVGLLTGDNVINPDAPIIVMTTEVLRNMLYAGSTLDELDAVIDEVHYLQDSYRGPVWEEVIIHLPHDIQLVCLSATVSGRGTPGVDSDGARRDEAGRQTHRPVELETSTSSVSGGATAST
ncbi:MAG: DEAD/DEAH box helicase [Acidimicrobiales bacterium]